MNEALYPILLALVPLVLALMFGFFSKRRHCPDCETQLPLLVSPLTKTRRQWLEGGWVCPECGVHVDSEGHKVEMTYVAGWEKLLSALPTLMFSIALAILLIRWLLQSTPADPVRPAPELVQQTACASLDEGDLYVRLAEIQSFELETANRLNHRF